MFQVRRCSGKIFEFFENFKIFSISAGANRKKYEYDPNHRNPMFANAETSLQYELLVLKNHYHPSVSLFAQNILNVGRFLAFVLPQMGSFSVFNLGRKC